MEVAVFLLLSSVRVFHRRRVSVWFEAVRMYSALNETDVFLYAVRLVEIVHLNSGLSAGFIVGVGDSLGVSSEAARNRCGFALVCF